MRTIGRLTAATQAADAAAFELVMQYDKLGDELDAMPVTRRFFEAVDRHGDLFADIVQLVALGMDVAAERPLCPKIPARSATGKIMAAHGILPKSAPGKVARNTHGK
jgi:hypothetical protein